MPDIRRTYTADTERSASAKPAYFYYPQTQGHQSRYRQPTEQFRTAQSGGQFVDSQGYPVSRAQSPPRPQTVGQLEKPTGARSNELANLGQFHQQPDGTIVMVQPTPVDPYENRAKCAKFVIFGSNVVLLIVGLSLLAFGVWLKIDDRFRDLLSENFRQVTAHGIDPVFYIGVYIIIATALGMIIVSCFGCCGAILDHQCLLVCYFVSLMALFFLEVSVLALVLMKREKIENDVGDSLDYMVQHYYQGPGIVTEVMDMLQMTFRCCGNSGCADYAFFRQNVPGSCDTACDGCRYRMFRFFRDGFIVLGVAMLFVFVAEIFAISFSIYLFCVMREHPTTRRRYFYYKSAEPTKRVKQMLEPMPAVPKTPVKKPL